MNLQRMVTFGGYKLILYPEPKVWKLFHVAEDPLERHNLVGEPGSLDRAQQLFAQLQDLQIRYADPLDLTVRFPELVSTASVRP
jgi:arylsulfatase A-like enzyme